MNIAWKKTDRKTDVLKWTMCFGLGVLLIYISGCGRVQDIVLPEQQPTQPRVSMIYPEMCLGDMAYCDQLQKGVKVAENALGIDIAETESGQGTWDTLLREAAQRSDLVITAGFQLAEPTQRVAPEFPNVRFVLIDSFVDAPNITSVTYRENEGSFLVGAIAALKTETNKVGYIGAVDVPLLRKFEAGYVAGVQAINPDIDIVIDIIATDGTGFSNITEAKRLADQQYESGVDIIYTVAAGAGDGAVTAAKERQKYVIWVDDNRNATAPDIFLTSMVKRVDNSVADVVNRFAAGQLPTGEDSAGLKEEAVAYALDAHNRPHLSEEILMKVDALKAQIISGAISVPTEVDRPLP